MLEIQDLHVKFHNRDREAVSGVSLTIQDCLNPLIMATTFPKVSSESARFMSWVSAPNISGTSVRIVVPPFPIRISENLPTSGFAVIPENPSLP